jgi:hypothetical protein
MRMIPQRGEVVRHCAAVEGDRRQTMKRPFLVPVMVLTISLGALGIIAGILQRGLESLGSSTFTLLMAASFFCLFLIFDSTWALLSALLPWGYSRLSARERRLGGILVFLPLLVGVLNACAGYMETSPFFVPLLLLNAVGVSAALWFLPFCIGHLLVRDRPALFKVFWMALLLLGNLIAVPVYWYIFVWPPHLAFAPRRQI